jgi:hypothetical protein
VEVSLCVVVQREAHEALILREERLDGDVEHDREVRMMVQSSSSFDMIPS